MNDNDLLELSRQVGEALLARQWVFATAESCTGGWVAKAITDVSGSSAWYHCGFVTYSNNAKQAMLGVNSETLERWGAVSAQTASEMALGAKRVAVADIALSVTGVAGPGGGSETLPVGSVWLGFAFGSNEVITELHHFSGDRDQVRRQAASLGLKKILDRVKKIKLDTV